MQAVETALEQPEQPAAAKAACAGLQNMDGHHLCLEPA
jgi:hypothetical protein